MQLPTPIELVNDKGVMGQILRDLPRRVLEQAEKQKHPWSWLAEWVKKNPMESDYEGVEKDGIGVQGRGFKRTNIFRKAFDAAASQRRAFLYLMTVARGGGSISNTTWRLKFLAAKTRSSRKAAEHFADKELASILQTVRGREWLLENKINGLTVPPEVRAWAKSKYETFYAADCRRVGKQKADKKWKSPKTLRLKTESYSDKIAEAMVTGWITVGTNGFPGLCFISDEVLARLLGYTLPLPSLLNSESCGWKTIRTTRERIGLKKAEILFTGIEEIGENKWAILDRDGQRTHSISCITRQPFPPKL